MSYETKTVQQVMFMLKEEDMRTLVGSFQKIDPMRLVADIHERTRKRFHEKEQVAVLQAQAREMIDQIRTELNLLVLMEKVSVDLKQIDESNCLRGK